MQEITLEREKRTTDARLKTKLREAEATRDSIAKIATAEEQKSNDLRNYELERLRTKAVAKSLGNVPFEKAQWVTVGNESPFSSIASLLTTGKSLLTTDYPSGHAPKKQQ